MLFNVGVAIYFENVRHFRNNISLGFYIIVVFDRSFYAYKNKLLKNVSFDKIYYLVYFSFGKYYM